MSKLKHFRHRYLENLGFNLNFKNHSWLTLKLCMDTLVVILVDWRATSGGPGENINKLVLGLYVNTPTMRMKT